MTHRAYATYRAYGADGTLEINSPTYFLLSSFHLYQRILRLLILILVSILVQIFELS